MQKTLASIIAQDCVIGRSETKSHSDAANMRLDYIERNLLPKGSGIDDGCKIDREKSDYDRIVIATSFHHMNDVGMYDGWTDHTVTAKMSFRGLDITIGGRNRNDIKDYLHEVFYNNLSAEYNIYAMNDIPYVPV